jgi:regulator of sigma E protease
MNVEIPDGFIGKLIKQQEPVIWPRTPFEVGRFSKDSPGKDAGLEVDDRIIALNGQPMPFFTEFRTEIQNYKDQEIIIDVIRNNDTLNVPVTVSEAGLIGVYPKGLSEYYEFNQIEYSFVSAIPAGTVKAYTGVGNYLKSLKLLFSQEKAYESVGGFITIGNIFPSQWDWQAFWALTAFLSIMLAILNVLPIPALDGGHVMFLMYEIITRRKPSDKFLEYAQIVGMVILLGLLIFANGNDIIRLFRG